MRTAEELRAAGKSEGFITAYLAEDRRLSVDSLSADGQAPAPAPPPPVGSPGWEAAQRAAAALEQDAAREKLRPRQQARVEAYDADADEERNRALNAALMAEGPTRTHSPGGTVTFIGGVPVLAELKDGMIRQLRPAILHEEIILPADWDNRQAAWERQERRNQTELLLRGFGREECLRRRWVTDDDLQLARPEFSRHVELPRGLEAL